MAEFEQSSVRNLLLRGLPADAFKSLQQAMEGNDLPLTHEFLSVMLGVRRSGVTNELHIIEGLRAIRATRGNIRIIDRAKLEEIAGGCYGIPEREYARLIRLPVRRT